MALFLEDKHKKALVRLEIINKDTKEVNELGFATKIYMPEKEDIVLITSPSIFPDGIDAHYDEIMVHRWKPKPKEKDPVKVKNIESRKQADVNTVVFEGERKYFLQYKVLTEKEIKQHKELTACVFEGKKKVELQFENQGQSYKLSNVSKEGFDVKRAKGAPVIIKEYSLHILGIPRYNHKIVGVLSMNSKGDMYPALFKDGFLDEKQSSGDKAEAGTSHINKEQSNVSKEGKNVVVGVLDSNDSPDGDTIFHQNLLKEGKFVTEYTEKLKSSIKQQTDFLLSEEEDKKIRTDDIFTSVTIQRGKKHFEEPKDKRFGRRVFNEIQASSTKLTNCSEMFICPKNDDQKSEASCTTNPKSILLTGKAGIGKSLFCRKLVRDWSHDRLFEEGQENAKVPDFQFVFLLTFCQLQEEEEKRLDLRDILNRSSLLNEHSVIDEPLLQYMIDNPEKLLIILDGYDEYKHREKITKDFETRYSNDPHEKIPVPALIAKIMKGKMLNGAVVLTSSRPGEAEELKKIVFDVRCDIQGFSSLQVIEYIQKYFKANESMKNKALNHIKTNEILLSFGHIPVMCFLMCYYIKWHMTESKTTEKLPVTRTELYHEVIKVFIKKHSSSKYEEMEETKVQEVLEKLAELAVNLMMEDKYIFNEKDMKKFNLNDEEITNLKASGLLDCCPGVKKSPFEKPPLEFTFTHLTIQEFLCAFLFVEKKRIPEKKKTSDVTFMFMAGMFSKEKDGKMLKKLIKKIKPGDEEDKRNKLLTLSCLYEYKDDGFSTRVINNLKHIYCDRGGWIEFRKITDIDCLYIRYLLDIVNLINAKQTKRHSTFTQSFIGIMLHIGGSSLSASGIRMLCNSLVNISNVDVLSLECCKLDDECVEIICDMLPRTKITRLDLRVNNITDVGVKIICDMLPRTKITYLNLGGNNITDVGAQCLCSVLIRDDCPVKVLYLRGNNNITSECKLSLRQQLIPGVELII